MIAALIYWNLLSIDDICFYQKIHYQKDRYLNTMDLMVKDLILMIILSVGVILLEFFSIIQYDKKKEKNRGGEG